MSIVIEPSSPSGNSTPFAALVGKPEDMQKVCAAFVEIVRKSFDRDEVMNGRVFRQKIQTESEVKRRSAILGKWFRIMRADLGLGLSRTLDELPRALQAEIEHTEYKLPNKNRLWSPRGA